MEIKRIILCFIFSIFLIGICSAQVTDSSGISYGAPTGDNDYWGFIINTTCTSGINISSAALAAGVTSDTAFIIRYSDNSTLKKGTCSAGVCTFLGPSISAAPNSKFYFLTGLLNNGSFNQAQGSTSYPIHGTNINWIKGLLKYYTGYTEFTNLGFEFTNIISECITTLAASLNSPLNNSVYLQNSPILFNCTVAGSTPDNMTMEINKTLYTYSGTNNITFYNSYPAGNYNFSCNTSLGVSTATSGIYNFNTSIIGVNNQTYNSSTYEFLTETFILNVSADGLQPLSAILFYNGTNYGSGSNNGNNSVALFSKSITIPSSAIPNVSIFWSVNYGNININTSSNVQIVNPLMFGFCNSTLNSLYLNFTFKDELNQSSINATIDSFTLYYGFGSIATQNKSFSFSNSSYNPSYAFCFSPSGNNITESYSIQSSGNGYPSRKFISSGTLSSSVTNKILYLLYISSGQLVTFQIVNTAQQPLSGVIGNATKIINGILTTVGDGISGSDGGINFFVDPLLSYTFSFSYPGFSTFTFTTAPAQTSYTITLGSSSQNTSDYTRGISQSIVPPIGILNNNTNYGFNYTINSTYWALQSFGFNIYGNNTILLSSNSSSVSTGGIVSSYVNTLNYSAITMNYFYVINGTYINSSVIWYVQSISGNQFSILNFFTDLKNYFIIGMFGSTDFTLTIIIFLAISISIGIISFKFGFVSPSSIVAILTGLVILFDVGFGLDSYMNPMAASGAVPYLPSVLMLLIAIGTILKEAGR